MRGYVWLCFFLICAPVTAGVFKWVDEQGVVHYSDKSSSLAEEVRLPAGADSDTTQADTDTPTGGAEDAAGGYTAFEILQPETGQTFRTAETDVGVGILLEPALQKEHRLRLTVDGSALKTDFATTQVTLQNLQRGSHSVSASIVDAEGKVVATTPPVHFHLRGAPQPSP